MVLRCADGNVHGSVIRHLHWRSYTAEEGRTAEARRKRLQRKARAAVTATAAAPLCLSHL